jgi:hypothetical protein
MKISESNHENVGWISMQLTACPDLLTFSAFELYPLLPCCLCEILAICRLLTTDKVSLASISSAQKPKSIAGILKDSIQHTICKYLHFAGLTLQ